MIELIVYLIFVQPSGETYTETEKQYVIEQTREAISFWGHTSVIHESIIYPDQDVYTLPLNEWDVLPSNTTNSVTIYVVDNSESGRIFFHRFLGYAQDYYRFLTSTLTYTGATIAHELGHVLYGLPDLYLYGCIDVDIMCNALVAWEQKFIGCTSLESIGRPCTKYYLPFIGGYYE